MAKNDVLDRTVKLLQKKFGAATAVRGSDDTASRVDEVIPTGIEVVDFHLLGVGGLPVGRISEVYGQEGCGKTAFGLTALASCQRHGGVAVLADPEQSFDETRARDVFGVDVDELLLLQPPHLQMLFEQVKVVLAEHDTKGGPLLIVWDSVAGTKTKDGALLEAGKFTVGEVPRILGEEFKKLLPLLEKHRAHFLMLNQIRIKIGVMFGPNTTTPGGNPVKFYSSWRAEFFGGKATKDAKGRHLAKTVTLMVQKTRFSEPFRKVRIRFDTRMDTRTSGRRWSSQKARASHNVVRRVRRRTRRSW